MTVTKGELTDGDIRALSFGVTVSFSSGAQTLYSVPSGCNAVVTQVVARAGSGTQPVSFIVSVTPSGGNLTGSIATAGLSGTAANNLTLLTSTPVMLNGTSLIVTPLTNTSGMQTFDVIGYLYTSSL